MRRFPFFLGLAVASVLACISLLTWASAPPGMRWLGETFQEPSDAAVYMSYLRQGQDGHVFLSNLFAVEPHAARFDAFWSLLGLITRLNISPIVAYEAARFVMAIVLAFAVYVAAGWVTKNEEDKKLATLLAFCGVGMGWLYTVVIDAMHLWTPKITGAMDLASEFAIAPILFSAAHLILSLALLITALPFIWHGIDQNNRRSTLIGTAAGAALFLFHPYFIPLVGIFTLIALVDVGAGSPRPGRSVGGRGDRAPTLIHALVIALSLVPAALIYVPLAFDPVFRTHHLDVNVLPLIPWESSIPTLLPFVMAIVWRISRRIHLRENEHWLLAWIVAATLCLFLPLPFLRKFTEGLGIALVFLTLPVWIAMRDRIFRTNPSRVTRIYLSAAFLFLAALSPLNLIASQLTLIGRSDFSDYFYRPLPVFATWDYLAATTPTSSIILADDLWTTLWTPAHTGRRVWVAHDHETPSFNQKVNQYHELVATTDPSRARQILKDAGVTQFITTSDASKQRYSTLLATGWSVTHSEESVSVWEPIR